MLYLICAYMMIVAPSIYCVWHCGVVQCRHAIGCAVALFDNMNMSIVVHPRARPRVSQLSPHRTAPPSHPIAVEGHI
jgi:hypothetical protein